MLVERAGVGFLCLTVFPRSRLLGVCVLIAVDVGQVVVGIVYAVMLTVIALELVERHVAGAVAALVVAVASVVLEFGDPVKAFIGLDWDVVGLVIVASILSWLLEDSGIAGEAARFIVRVSGGNPVRFMLASSAVSGFLSLFLENVSVVIILAPVIMRAARLLNVNPAPIIIAVALSSNLSGSALLVGDPQAALVASAYGLGFLDYIFYDGRPSMFFVVTAAMAVAIASLPLYVRLEKSSYGGDSVNSVEGAVSGVRDKLYASAALLALAGKVVLLSLRKELGLSLTGAAAPPVLAVALVYGWRRPREVLKAGFDPPLLVFLVSIFFLVEYVEQTGLTNTIAYWISSLGFTLFGVTAIVIIVSALISSIMDNVPFIAAMIPVMTVLGQTYGVDPVVLSWALLLGATLGGGLTYIGAMPNYTAVRLLERSGYHVSFTYFSKIGVPYTLAALGTGALVYYVSYYDLLVASP